jgi:bifunctional non-homologous end joining protein LigD
MALAEYRRKRHFRRTPEPAGKTAGKATKRRTRGQLQYVIQKHAARRLHYDFRLELDGVLVSWAVPKGPSLDPADKRLAVHVEDHPLEYGKFEGRIPEGEYGAGEVIVWDRGTWTPDGLKRDPKRDLARGRLELHLDGEKLSGGWMLLRLKPRSPRDKDNWLLIKRDDEAARPAHEYDITQELPLSVKSGRPLGGEQSSAKPSRNGKPKGGGKPGGGGKSRRGKSRSRSRDSKLPFDASELQVQLATLVPEAPAGNDWLHEIKLDGYRMLAAVEKGAARLFTRNHLDWTARYPSVAAAIGQLPVASAVLDGELVALDAAGISRFQALQNAGNTKEDTQLVFFAFDLLALEGEDLRARPLVERKVRLAELLKEQPHEALRYSDHISGRGPEFLAECCQRRIEGIVSKRADRGYWSGRSSDWLKVKCLGREELVIGGWTESDATGRAFGALLVGYFEQGRFVYAGRVGTGFASATLKAVESKLAKLRTAKSPFAQIPARERRGKIRWAEPKLVAQIAFSSWTDSGILRHASFQGLREDKRADEVGRPDSLTPLKTVEQIMPRKTARKSASKKPAKTAKAKRGTRAKSQSFPATPTLGVNLTNPDRVLFPDVGLTKIDLVRYYTENAETILPHVAGRPLSMLRCPTGEGKPCFFQKHAAAGTPDVLRRVEIQERDKVEEYLVVDDAAGLVALAQMSVLEIHPWGSPADRVENPDRLIFDLDPGPGVAWQELIEAALLVRDVLSHLHLETFVKTSGGKGLHVVAPLTGETTWPTLKNFARAIAEHLAEQHPDRYTAKMAKVERKGRIFIDYLRNDRGATAVAPYSTRAKPGAPISLPLTWKQLAASDRSDSFTLADALANASPLKREAWKGFFSVQQSLPEFAANS